MSEDPRLDRYASSAAELKARIEAERRGNAFLVYRDADDRQLISELTGDQLTIGRRDDNDIPLEWDQQVSRLHAQLERIKGDWCLVDDGLSRNGSYLNGERVTGKRRLNDGDRICFGGTLMTYRGPAGDHDSTLAVRSEAPSIPLSETQRKVLIALARPMALSAFATPASNKEIAEELHLSVDAVKAQLRVLFERFALTELPQNQKRASLAAAALVNEVIKPHEL
jgi:pSer/pThr/pTyr-binding forkhead associated (FHA) protein